MAVQNTTIGPSLLVAFEILIKAIKIVTLNLLLLLLLVWHAPLGVRSAKRKHQSPEWTILSHSYRLIQ